jgi:hypothetical protein
MQPDTDSSFQKLQPDQEIKPNATAMLGLIESMLKVDLDAPEAVLNSTSISDGEGGRILL